MHDLILLVAIWLFLALSIVGLWALAHWQQSRHPSIHHMHRWHLVGRRQEFVTWYCRCGWYRVAQVPRTWGPPRWSGRVRGTEQYFR